MSWTAMGSLLFDSKKKNKKKNTWFSYKASELYTIWLDVEHFAIQKAQNNSKHLLRIS